MDNETWYRESHRRLGLVARYFKPKSDKPTKGEIIKSLRDIQTIADFIETAKDVSKEEAEALT